MIDVMLDIQELSNALDNTGIFSERSPKSRLEFVQQKSIQLSTFIFQYVNEDRVYVHTDKRKQLINAVDLLHELGQRARVYALGVQPDFSLLKKVLVEVVTSFEHYANCGGSVYLFRHCEKAKRNKVNSGKQYDGIPSSAVQKQAAAMAAEIVKEIQISPRPVRLVLFNSEMERTDIFAKIFAFKAIQVNQHSEGKVIVEGPMFSDAMSFTFTKEAFSESMPLLKNPYTEAQLYIKWMNHADEFATFKHQPDPNFIYNKVNSFMGQYLHAVAPGQYYTIVIGVSHSWIIDIFLYKRYPHLANAAKLIDTASFCKAECRSLNYLGNWISFP